MPGQPILGTHLDVAFDHHRPLPAAPQTKTPGAVPQPPGLVGRGEAGDAGAHHHHVQGVTLGPGLGFYAFFGRGNPIWSHNLVALQFANLFAPWKKSKSICPVVIDSFQNQQGKIKHVLKQKRAG